MAQRGRAAGSGGARRPTGRGPSGAPPARQVGGSAAGAALRARVADTVGPLVAAAGYDLEELVVSRVGRRNVIKVIVDADGGVSLDAVADLSRRISDALDIAEAAAGDFGSGPYTLEVSSPGVDRPLTEPRHWRRNVGRLVKAPVDDKPRQGRVVAATDQGVVLDIDGIHHEIAYERLGTGRVQIEFGRPADATEGAPEPGDVDDDIDDLDDLDADDLDEEEHGQEDQA